MATAKKSRSPSRSRRSPRAMPASPKERIVRQRLMVGVRWALAFARPRTAPDLLAFALVLLAVATFTTFVVGDVQRREAPGGEILWCVLLVLAALATRLSPWWRAQIRAMTPDRARNGTASFLLLIAAVSLSWYLASSKLGLGNTFLFLGPFSSPSVAPFVLVALVILSVILVTRMPVGRWLHTGLTQASNGWDWVQQRMKRARQRQVLASAQVDWEPSANTRRLEVDAQRGTVMEPDAEPAPALPVTAMVPAAQVADDPLGSDPTMPPINIFVPAPKGPVAQTDVEHNARRIEETLASFNVGARVVEHHSGPVVTRYDVQPDRGVKVRRITELQNDLALALAAPTIRIQAPVPGKPVVGIEIPNLTASMVALRDLLESDAYTSMKAPLKVVLGKDVAGNPTMIDLARMPHLLIAGATGSGKSVCVNAIISCLLYQNTPEQVRLMMIDPKMVELTVYNGVPHLYSPVVTQMDKVVGVLQWAIREMERRYQLFADNTVRNIQRFNDKMEASGQKRLPYIVLIVDELADLMMVAPEDVEDAICRLAQLARAAGIHLVIATQRPSVDVVTGLIKANFPARIAFAMTSQVDSRTILDTAGAEKLLGRGDMLYQPPDAPKPVRLQGAHLSDQEIEQLVEFWHRSPLLHGVQQVPPEDFAAAEKAASDAGDELLGEAIRVVREYQHASVTLLQRRLKVGYARAARLMDQLEERGIVGPADGSKQRPVLPEEETDPDAA